MSVVLNAGEGGRGGGGKVKGEHFMGPEENISHYRWPVVRERPQLSTAALPYLLSQSSYPGNW